MNNTQLMAAVNGAGQGRTTLDPPSPYSVSLIDGSKVMVFAHTYTILDGCLVFTVMKAKNIMIGDPPEKTTAVYQTFPKTFAAGRWSSVEEVFIPSPTGNAGAN